MNDLDDENEDQDGSIGKLKKIKIEKISNTILGLKTYEVKISDNKMNQYVKWTESNRDPTISVWTFITALFLLILNVVGKNIKNSYPEEYAVRKVVESYFNMEVEEMEGVRASQHFLDEMARIDDLA